MAMAMTTTTQPKSAAAAALVANFRNMTAAILKTTENVKPIKSGGVSFPIKIQSAKQCGATQGRTPSVCLTGVVGSLKNCCGPDVVVEGGGDRMFIPIKKGAVASKLAGVTLPRSIVDDREITHKLVTKGSRISVFCDAAQAACVVRNEYYYVVSAKATFNLREPKTGNAQPGAAVPQSGAIGFRFKQQVPLGSPLGMTPFPKQAVPDEDGGGRSVVATTAAGDGEIPPAVPELSGGFLTESVAKAYEDPNTPVEVKRRLELEYPELAGDRSMPRVLLDQGYGTSFAINCECVIPTQKEDFLGHGLADLVELYKETPEQETVIDATMLNNPKVSMMIVARPADVFDVVAADRLLEMNCGVPVLTVFEYTKTVSSQAGGTGATGTKTQGVQLGGSGGAAGQMKTSPWSCYAKRRAAWEMCYRFRAIVTSWPPGTAYSAAGSNMFYATLKGTVFQDMIKFAFGITSLDAWEKFAELLVENTEAWLTTVFQPDETRKLELNYAQQADQRPLVSIKVIDILADLATALRERIGIPITAKKATELIGESFPNEAALRAATPYSLSAVTCLSEHAELLKEAIVSGCSFYAITNSAIHRSQDIILANLGQEIGSALFSADWYDFDKPYEIEDASKVLVPGEGGAFRPLGAGKVSIAGTDKIRMKTMQLSRDLLQPTAVAYVYSVRPAAGITAARALAAQKVFAEGGNYDHMGIPLVGDAVFAIADEEPALLEEAPVTADDDEMFGCSDEPPPAAAQAPAPKGGRKRHRSRSPPAAAPRPAKVTKK